MASKARKALEALLKCFLTDDLNEFMLHKRRILGALKNEAPMSPMSPVLIGKHTQRLLERCAFFFDEKSTNKRKP
jgi:hypothetical protein